MSRRNGVQAQWVAFRAEHPVLVAFVVALLKAVLPMSVTAWASSHSWWALFAAAGGFLSALALSDLGRVWARAARPVTGDELRLVKSHRGAFERWLERTNKGGAA